MAEGEKVTTMVLNVDLQCSKCYNKVKKLLCKFPEIRDQTYDEKENKVTITVVCCSPEKIRDKLCCKGRGCITSIEIKEPEPTNPQPTNPQPKNDPVKQQICIDLDLELGLHLQGRQETPPPLIPPLGFCYSECYSGRPWGPCWHGWRVQYDGCYGRPVYDTWGWGGCTSGCATNYCTEQNQQGCTIM